MEPNLEPWAGCRAKVLQEGPCSGSHQRGTDGTLLAGTVQGREGLWKCRHHVQVEIWGWRKAQLMTGERPRLQRGVFVCPVCPATPSPQIAVSPVHPPASPQKIGSRPSVNASYSSPSARWLRPTWCLEPSLAPIRGHSELAGSGGREEGRTVSLKACSSLRGPWLMGDTQAVIQ